MFFAIALSWIAAGLLVGFIASRAVNLRGDAPLLGIAAAVGGALVAGVIYAMVSGHGVSVWTVWGVVAALVGAVLAVIAWHLIRSRTISHDTYVPRSSY